MFVNKQEGNDNKDLRDNKDLQYYLDMTEGFKSSFGDFKVIQSNGFNIVDESQACPVGYKARSGEFLLSTLKAQGVKEVVYVQPRRGFAGISLSYLCKKYDMDLTLIMPASKKSSDHQRLCIEYGAKPLFLRVLSRTLQIALPNTEFFNVAVSRNIQQGDLGRANFISYHKAFSQKSDVIPTDFDCENAYDAKGWDYLTKHGEPGDWFFNVAGEAPMTTLAEEEVDSYRDWRDLRDFEQYLNKPATLF